MQATCWIVTAGCSMPPVSPTELVLFTRQPAIGWRACITRDGGMNVEFLRTEEQERAAELERHITLVMGMAERAEGTRFSNRIERLLALAVKDEEELAVLRSKNDRLAELRRSFDRAQGR
jgi:hypothetical protein